MTDETTPTADETPAVDESPAVACDRCVCDTCPGLDADPTLLAEHSKVCATKHF